MKKYNIVDLLTIDSIDRSIKIYGIEGAEMKIKQLYAHPSMQKLKICF